MSKRLNLREFQQSMIDRMQAKDISVDRVSTLGVQIVGNNYLVDMADIGEVLPLPQLANVPYTQPWFRGVANVRGDLYGVVDIAAYENYGTANGATHNRVLLISERHSFNAGLLVDRVLGLRDARSWRKEVADGRTVYLDEQGATWHKLDVRGLLDQQEFLQVGV